MEYKFFREGVWEEVIKEKWWWEAHYADGTALKQFDDKTGLFHQFRERPKQTDKLQDGVGGQNLLYTSV